MTITNSCSTWVESPLAPINIPSDVEVDESSPRPIGLDEDTMGPVELITNLYVPRPTGLKDEDIYMP